MREQSFRIRTGAARKRAAILVLAVAITVLTAAVIWFYLYEPPYQPPPFESEAVQGIPDPPQNMGYGQIDALGKFTFGIIGVMYRQKDGSLKLYLTNHEENEAYLMCEVIDIENKKILYRSGLLKPGEYVESLYPLKKMKNEAIQIEVNVYALDLESYISLGSVTLDNLLQPFS